MRLKRKKQDDRADRIIAEPEQYFLEARERAKEDAQRRYEAERALQRRRDANRRAVHA